MTKIFIIILATSYISCNSPDNSSIIKNVATEQVEKKDSFPIKELFIEKGDEDGWGADIRLSITKIFRTDTSISYFVNSLFDEINVGFQISIPKDLPKNENGLAQVLIIQRSGIISDNLIQVLSELYKEKVDTTLHFVASKRIAFIDLDEFAKFKTGQEPSKKTTAKDMKIFFEAENPDDNGELFININEEEHWLEIREKDKDYRKQVIKGFTTQ